MEYVDVEGLIQPILTIIVNARESGSVDRIVGEEGSLLQKGDTILLLENPDLIHSIEEQRDDLEKQLISFREKEIEMEQKSLTICMKPPFLVEPVLPISLFRKVQR